MGGGIGYRFWPRSTEKTPKQFIHLSGDGTMIQNTYKRLLKIFEIDEIYLVTSYKYRHTAKEQLPDIPEENFIYEQFHLSISNNCIH